VTIDRLRWLTLTAGFFILAFFGPLVPTALSQEKPPTAMLIVVDDNTQQSFSVTFSDFFEALTGFNMSDLVDAPEELQGLIDTVGEAVSFVADEVFGGMFNMLADNSDDSTVGLNRCLADLSEGIGATLKQSREDNVDPLPIFRERFGEAFVAECLRQIAEPHYDRVEVLADDDATFDNFKQTLENLHNEGYFIDLLINLHGCGRGPYGFNNLEDAACPDGPYVAFSDSFNSSGFFTRPYGVDDFRTINNGEPMRLNGVYLVNCGGKDFNDVFLELGALSVNAPDQLNYYTLLSPIVFMQNWANGMTMQDAAEVAYDFEKLFFSGLDVSVTLDLTWVPFCFTCEWTLSLTYEDAVGEHLSSIGLGEDAGEPVDHQASSERITDGNSSQRKASLSESPLPPPTEEQPEPEPLAITSITPGSGGPGVEVTITGTGFRVPSPLPGLINPSVVLFDGVAVETTVNNIHEVTFTVPDDAECGAHTIEVQNPNLINTRFRNPGAISNTIEFPVLCVVQPPPFTIRPQINDVFPGNSANPGSIVIVHGSGFKEDSEILFGGAVIESDFVDNTNLRFEIPLGSTCGLRFIQVRNPGDPELLSNQRPFSITEPCEGDEEEVPNQAPSVNLMLEPISPIPGAVYSVRLIVEVVDPDGDTLNPLNFEWYANDLNDGIEANFERLFNGSGNPIFGDEITVSFGQPDPAGYRIRVIVPDGQGNFGQAEIDVATPSGSSPSPSPSPSPQVMPIHLALDLNKDDFINDVEIQIAIAYWANGERVPESNAVINDCLIKQLTETWIAGKPLSGFNELKCTSTRPLSSIQLAHLSMVNAIQLFSPNAMEREFRVLGHVMTVRIDLFDLSGQLKLSQENFGPTLRFGLQDQHGERLSNGTYFYVVTAQTSNGLWRSQVHKLLVLN